MKSLDFESLVFFLIASCFLPAHSEASTGNISETEKFAWSETSGWINFRPVHGGVTVHDTHLSGFVWAADIGWIKLGVDSGGPYGNSTKDDWGVNRDTGGVLSGFGWSETSGWINFAPSHSGVTVDPATGVFTGYAWAANRGYIHFQNESPVYGVQTTNIDSDGDFILAESDICLGGDDRMDMDGDGVPDFCDPCPLNNPDTADSDGDGVADCVDPFPDNATYFSDVDSDGMPDLWEEENGLLSSFDDADDDADDDGLTNIDEFYLGTFANRVDSDGDGLSDFWEVEVGLDPSICVATEDSEGDYDIDGIDLAQFAEIFADRAGAADINGDGRVDTWDLTKIAAVFGRGNVCQDFSGAY